jgi:hypothetical protein
MAKMIPAAQLAAKVLSKVRTPAIPYVEGRRSDRGTDCINLVGWCMDELGGAKVERGSNSAFRANVQGWRELAEAKRLGMLKPGALVFLVRADTTGKWPDGDYYHVGVYVGDVPGLKTPDGAKADVVHASQSREGVYPSSLQINWAKCVVAWLKGVDYDAGAVTVVPRGPGDNPADIRGPGIGVGVPADITEAAPGATPTAEPGPGQAKVITTTSGLRLRKGPSRTAAPIKEMPIGTIVDVLQVQGEWAEVRYRARDGTPHQGWCCVGENGTEYLQFGT